MDITLLILLHPQDYAITCIVGCALCKNVSCEYTKGEVT